MVTRSPGCFALCLLLSSSAWKVGGFHFINRITRQKNRLSPLKHQYQRLPQGHSSPSLISGPRLSTRCFQKMDKAKTEKDENRVEKDVPVANVNDSVLDKSNANESFFDTFLASFPELSFWEVAQDDEMKLRKRDLIRSLLRRLANLSLQDYSWRSNFFKKTEADRRVEESLARMMGEDAAYVRPMDAADDKIGPLGLAEKKLVEWLSLVIEEEGRRARMIAASEGDLVRPMDLQSGEGGPLSALENATVSFLNSIRDSEQERAKTMTLRPKDLEAKKRGPLGEAEYRVVRTLEEIRVSEMVRMNQSRERGGEVVRPIDVPGPLGELERWYVELFSAELQRYKDRKDKEGKMIRPKDASLIGPIGEAEQQVSDALDVIQNEERERLRSIQKVLIDNRPMEKNRDSALGWIEASIVGIVKGPQLIFRVIDRVNELLQSSGLTDKDEDVLNEASIIASNEDGNGKKDYDENRKE